MLKKKKTVDDIVFDAIVYILGFILIIVFVYPLYFVVIASLSDPLAVTRGDVLFGIVDFSMESYIELFKRSDIWIGYRNSIVYTVLGTSINVVLTVLGAYVLSCEEFLPRNIVLKLMVFTMFFNGGLIPAYLLVQGLGIYGTIWAVVLPGAVNVQNLIIARTFFIGNIPKELKEAAFLDGCSHTRLLITVIIPLSKSILAVLALFYGVTHWNSYFNAMIYLPDDDMASLQLVLRRILLNFAKQDSSGGDVEQFIRQSMLAQQLKYSSVIVASIPALIAYPFVKKYFVKGVMIGSIKG